MPAQSVGIFFISESLSVKKYWHIFSIAIKRKT